ncbi:carbonic anhydrase [Acetobacterium tundrae]|uniref:Carbonic anhydrase n=1 Tax=Acetobacterium tundrae TaxID=132932 RepID=A0ABR6WIK8_9FIRM|nr:carbonic anhydrase [Acetobacterium tundrae]MBC3796291.1 carbonic anhydrase [Acetobacterium tundrae]
MGIKGIETVIETLKKGNENFTKLEKNHGDISSFVRTTTSRDGQKPDAVIVTCSDSRVPPEHIFSAGIGELFVIRTAGNVIGDFELGSIEYAVGHLGVRVVIVLGHNHCGAVSAAMFGHGEGHIQSIIDEIKPALKEEADVSICERLNIENSRNRILSSKLVNELVEAESVKVFGAKYDISTGKVDFF